MFLYNLCLDTVGRVLKKPSNVLELRGILPNTIVQDLSNFVYMHLDPRTSLDYFAWRNESNDDIAEAGLTYLEHHNFSIYNNPLHVDVFWILNFDTLVDNNFFTESEYFEWEFHNHYFLQSSIAKEAWPGYYCGNCIKDICKLTKQTHCIKTYNVLVFDRDDVINEIVDRDNYCNNCFVTPLFSFVSCSPYHYINAASHKITRIL